MHTPSHFLRSCWLMLALLMTGIQLAGAAASSPNFIVIFCDDLGYGDLSCYGHPTIRTPHLDRMAAEGIRFTDFYASAPVCTPSRAGLLTGRYAVRSGMASSKRRVLFPDSKGGLPSSEITIAKALKSKGYTTAAVGKWHLGHLPPYLPTSHGFDSYYGIPYSNDMDRDNTKGPKGREAFLEPKSEYWNVPLMQNEKVVERPADQDTITRRYTVESVRYIRANKDKPFFLYLAHNLPHVPLFVGQEHRATSRRGLYGDVIEEIDWSVGQILETLRKEKLAENTFVFFTSDNGPWLLYDAHGGSAGLLREGKGSTWDGGQRVPGIAWWPGKIPAGKVEGGIASTLDLFPTILQLAGVGVPMDREIDGVDMAPLLFGKGKGNRDFFAYYRDVEVYAARLGRYKAHFSTKSSYGKDPVVTPEVPELYDLETDPGEQYNIAAKHPQMIGQIRERVKQHERSIKTVENQLEKP
ncbi:MAG TPA: sulfatase [Verrucomicrobiae bacterium]